MKKSLFLLCFCLTVCVLPSIEAAEWDVFKVDYQSDTGKYTALALDSNDYPHIAYQDSTGPRLKYAKFIGTGWNFEIIPDTTQMGYEAIMLLDSAGLARIIHLNVTTFRGVLTQIDAMGNWDTFTYVSSAGMGMDPSVCLDEDGRMAVAYRNGNDSQVMVSLEWSSSVWYDYVVADADLSCTSVQAPNFDTRPIYVAFSDIATNTMKCARSVTPGWTVTVIDTDVTVSSCEMQLDENEYEHIMYIDGTGDLKYARNSSSGWSIETLFTDASPAVHSLSYIRTPAGHNHICFYDTSEQLAYATNASGSWIRETVDSEGNVGTYCSMALDSTGLPHISYYDSDNADLKYARQRPAPTPTPTPSTIAYELEMDDVYYTAGETFRLDRTWINTTAASATVDEYILLDVLGMYWFWPTWSESLTFSQWTVPVGGPTTDTILTFEWPVVDGSFDGIRFWGAFLIANSSTLIDYDMIEWGYGDSPPPLTLTSPAFASGQTIPEKFTCDGVNISPELIWNQPDQSIMSWALIMDDPDAPGGTWTHWIIYRIPSGATGLDEALSTDPELPDGSRQGLNSWGTHGYRGPCPPSGPAHRYFFTLYALDNVPALATGATMAELLDAMNGHILYETQLMGTYQR